MPLQREQLSGSTVLVTGAGGFIGSHLAESLAKSGYRVRCLLRRSRPSPDLLDRGVQFVQADLARENDLAEALAGVDVVFHLAGVTKARRVSDYFRGNTNATVRLVRAFQQARARQLGRLERFVFVSSLAATGPSAIGGPIGEDAGPGPVSLYGRSKLLAESAIRQLGDVPFSIIRPPIVFGPKDTDFLLMLRSASIGWMTEVASRREKSYSLIHVNDLVRGIVQVAESPAALGRTYHLANEKPYLWGEMISIFSQLFGRRIRTVRVPAPLAWCVGAASEIVAGFTAKPTIMSRDKVREGKQDSWVCDVSRAAREIGFRAELSLRDGLKDTIAWYRAAGWL